MPHPNITRSHADTLVIVRAGDRSLHPTWIDNKAQRSFDLWVSFYGDGDIPAETHCAYTERIKGPKWGPVHKLLEREWQRVRAYDYVWIPDDDLAVKPEGIERMFDLCRRHAFEVAQPALSADSYITHFITMRRRALAFRWTNFVEVMAPCFRIDALDALRGTFPLSASGWGLDYIWHAIRGRPYRGFAIVDAAPIRHTRPIYGGSLYASDTQTMSPFDDMAKVIAPYGPKIKPASTGGVLVGGSEAPAWLIGALDCEARLAKTFQDWRRAMESERA